ncbi:MFS transporter [Nocardia sp. Root136]|uniref:MFS transporter n=1 Tax=Nocardia sp. Root136 TaxID=1736458 RepID=UPI0006F244B8|nr:MFS transporter [Nocardia sp. Root136]KQY38310.1 MFS transporter [Nocardia sp. Root136]
MAKNRSIIMLSTCHACVDIYQGSVAALVPFFVAEHAYSYAAVSGIVLAATLLSSVAQPTFGLLTDRWAMPWLLPVSTIVAGLGIALSGLSGSYALTLALVAVSGVGVAAYHPESARVARLVSQGRHSAMGWFALGGNLGFAAAPLIVTAVVVSGGLRFSPLLMVPALAGSVLCLPVLRALRKPAFVVSGNAVGAGTDDKASFVKLPLAVVFRSIAFVGLSTFISLYAQQRMGGDVAAGTAALFVLYLGGAVGSVLGGALADRWERVTVARWSYLLTVAAIAGIVFVPGPAMYLFVALTSVGLYIPFSLQVTLGQDYLPTRVGTASGITLGLTVSIGGLATPVIGSIADATSLRTALTPLILMPALSCLLLRTLPEPAAPKSVSAVERPSPPATSPIPRYQP